MPYKVKRRGNDLEIHEHLKGNCHTLGDLEVLVQSEARRSSIKNIYMVAVDGSKTPVDWLEDHAITLEASAETVQNKPRKMRLVAVLLFMIALYSLFNILVNMKKVPKRSMELASQAETELNAKIICDRAIKQFIKDPKKTEIPWVNPTASNERRITFHWDRYSKMIRSPNSFGLSVPVTVSCVVELPSYNVIELLINGENPLK